MKLSVPKGESPLCAGVVPGSEASGKVVWGDPYTEVSQTAVSELTNRNHIQRLLGKNWTKFKRRLKYLTRKTTPMSLKERIQKLNEVIRGWINNYRMASIYAKLKDLEGWLCNRLRYCIWHHWKKPEKKRRSLIRLGVDGDHAYAWSRTRKGGWAVAQSPILRTTITKDRLKKRGYNSLTELYRKISPQFNEPLYTRPVRTVV